MSSPELIARAVEPVMSIISDMSHNHNKLVDTIAKSDMTTQGIIVGINNNIYKISNKMYPFVQTAINLEFAKIIARNTQDYMRVKSVTN